MIPKKQYTVKTAYVSEYQIFTILKLNKTSCIVFVNIVLKTI